MINTLTQSINNIIVNISMVLLCIWVVLEMPSVHLCRWFLRAIIIIATVLFSVYVPLYHGYNLLILMHSVVGDLSITTLFILLLLIFQDFFISSGWEINFNVMNRSVSWIVFIIGIIFYISRFGLIINFDLYKLGYYPQYTLLFLIFLELVIWYINKIFALIWLIALIAFYFKFQSSVNLWDYMYDPVLLIIALYKISTFTN
ncbi:MAG TPA: hypothetical protein PKD00_09805 [Burkholderiales bacterium]|nr:hypothetical protein [Burkholderiales bacterium]